ncbi:hypothetical protein FB567DRAFT_462216 [Paraphoma chrysanthemicola]|uniref:Uncharacterized protein n=1 Tax=Paraphoma chrysanthemicola TaxID=798071 RepID=A0A8K0RGA1_9PLEO|nr:hypothetical protein FB567DRAFT_462216 [Paraphoma chrysanthemicola]
MASESVQMPPSPRDSTGFFAGIATRNPTKSADVPIRPKTPSKPHKNIEPSDRTDSGIKKTSSRTSYEKKMSNVLLALEKAAEKPFPFMELPGEVRNMIYRHTQDNPRQALLVHRPRYASLRSRTRMDRARTLPSDVVDQELNQELNKKKGRKESVPRETNRPFWGLTQVCRQIRTEYRPMYLAKQEIGMDLTEVVRYLQTFYFNAPDEFLKLDLSGQRTADMPFNGNLTIAVGDKPSLSEQAAFGIEVIPLLDLWANSFKIEAGFGRYLRKDYMPQIDGEAKDLYRLFGRRVMRNRQCSGMNNMWRTILRTRLLASVTLHRMPATQTMSVAALTAAGLAPQPYIHILFRPECAEPWMTQFVSEIPKDPDWLTLRGFGNMEFFDVKVGVAPPGYDRRI